MASLLSALALVTAVGFAFANTRKIGLLGLGAITYLYPAQVLAVGGIVMAIYLIWRIKK